MSQFVQLFMISGLMLWGAQKWMHVQKSTEHLRETLRQSWHAEQQLYHCLYSQAQVWNRSSQAITSEAQQPCDHHEVTIGSRDTILTGSLVLEDTQLEQFDHRNWFIAFSTNKVKAHDRTMSWSF